MKARELEPGHVLRKPGGLDWHVIVVTREDNGRTVLVDCVDERGHMPCVQLYLDEDVDAYKVGDNERLGPWVLQRERSGPQRGDVFPWDGEQWRITSIRWCVDEYHIEAVAVADETRTYFGRWSSAELEHFPRHPLMPLRLRVVEDE